MDRYELMGAVAGGKPRRQVIWRLKSVEESVKVKVDANGDSLEALRPLRPVEWTYVAEIEWGDDIYHQGDTRYRMARTGPNTWVMEAVQRNACLDDVTEEDVEEGRLNDDQIQALWNMTLEEARSQEFCRIVAVCEGGDEASAKSAMLRALGMPI